MGPKAARGGQELYYDITFLKVRKNLFVLKALGRSSLKLTSKLLKRTLCATNMNQ